MWQFEHPELLHLLWLFIPLGLAFAGFRSFYRGVALHLGCRDMAGYGSGLRRFWWSIPAMICMIIAIASPQRREAGQIVIMRSVDVVLILDISNSMLAMDVSPNRLEPARDFSLAFTRLLGGSRMAVVMMAGNAWVQIPMTTDLEAVAMSIQAAHPDMAIQQGTNMSGAFRLAGQLLREVSDDNTDKVVVLVSDGENHESSFGAALRALKKANTLIRAVGVGTEQGGYIPKSTGVGQVKYGPDGRPVRTRLEASVLKRIAPGRYHQLNTFNTAEIAAILAAEILNNGTLATTVSQQASSQSYFQVFLGAALFFLILGLWWEKRAKQHHFE